MPLEGGSRTVGSGGSSTSGKIPVEVNSDGSGNPVSRSAKVRLIEYRTNGLDLPDHVPLP